MQADLLCVPLRVVRQEDRVLVDAIVNEAVRQVGVVPVVNDVDAELAESIALPARQIRRDRQGSTLGGRRGLVPHIDGGRLGGVLAAQAGAALATLLADMEGAVLGLNRLVVADQRPEQLRLLLLRGIAHHVGGGTERIDVDRLALDDRARDLLVGRSDGCVDVGRRHHLVGNHLGRALARQRPMGGEGRDVDGPLRRATNEGAHGLATLNLLADRDLLAHFARRRDDALHTHLCRNVDRLLHDRSHCQFGWGHRNGANAGAECAGDALGDGSDGGLLADLVGDLRVRHRRRDGVLVVDVDTTLGQLLQDHVAVALAVSRRAAHGRAKNGTARNTRGQARQHGRDRLKGHRRQDLDGRLPERRHHVGARAV